MRMRVAVVVWSIACGCSGGGGGGAHVDAAIVGRDAPGDEATCKMARDQALDRACGSAGDCAVVASEDCCGEIDIAVHAGTQSGFPAVEASFDRCLACAPSGCAHQIEAEDGSPATSGTTIVAACVMSRCTTVVQ